MLRDGSVVAWVRPAAAGPTTPFRIVGAHTDSPGFKLKPQPTVGSHGWLQAGVEVYGGPLLNSWLDRELELAGRLVTRAGAEHLVRTGPFLRIPQLAIHLDRAVNDGLTLDKQRHTTPVFGVGDATQADLLGHLASLAGLDGGDIAGYDILTADTAAPARFGLGDVLFAAGRMDNLTSVHAGLRALLDAADRRRRPHQRARRLRPRGARLGVAVRRVRPDARRRPHPHRGRARCRTVASSCRRTPGRGACRRTPATPCTRTTRSGTTPPTSRCPAAARCSS